MKKMFKYLNKKENGNAIILVALAMGGMIAMLGLIIDGGHLYMQKSHLQKTANAAALSGGQEIPNGEANVRQVVDEVLNAHGEQSSMPDWVPPTSEELQVVLDKDVPLFFSSIFGFDFVPIKVSAKVQLNPLGEATGAVPLGISESELANLPEDQSYALKVGAGDSTTGNFGALVLEKPGAKSYYEALEQGYDGSLKAGEPIDTQTGDMPERTMDIINHRIDNCPHPPGETWHRECSRIMLVVVYKDPLTTNGKTSVKVTGFAYFYLTEKMMDKKDSIRGTFIKRAGAGSTGPDNPTDRGAYALKLTE